MGIDVVDVSSRDTSALDCSLHAAKCAVAVFRRCRDVKRITYLSPTLQYRIHTNLNVETALRITTAGQNFPAGYMWVAGISYSGNPFEL